MNNIMYLLIITISCWLVLISIQLISTKQISKFKDTGENSQNLET